MVPQDDKERQHWCLRMMEGRTLASQDDGGKGLVGSGGEEKPLLDGGGGLRFPVCHPERSEGSSFGGRSGLGGERSFGGFAVSG